MLADGAEIQAIFVVPHGTILQQHDLSAKWPAMDAESFRELVASVRVDGVDNPIVLYDGEVLDGWHRYNACQLAGIDCPAIQYDGDDPAGFVIRANRMRRHLTPAERSDAVNACRGWMPIGRPRTDGQADSNRTTIKQRAEEANVSESSISRSMQRQRQREAEERGESVETHAPAKSSESDDFPDFAPPVDKEPDSDMVTIDVSSPNPTTLTTRTVEQQLTKRTAEQQRAFELQQQVEDLQQRLDFRDAEPSEQEQTLVNLQLENQTLRTQVDEWMAKASNAERQVEMMRNRINDLETTIRDYDDTVKGRRG